MLRKLLMGLCAFALVHVSPAQADVGVVLNESLATGGDRISRTGHSAVYFSGICPQTPVELRLCRRGEHGSILSTYTGFHETQSFNWNVVPLGVYLYGAEDARDRPLVGNDVIKHGIEERYRTRYLAAYCPGAPCATDEKADWREMAGAGLSRNIYIFVVETTREQDLEIIEKFNDLPNKNRFNAVTRNCADFTRDVINTYFPHAARPEYLNDFGMSSPKAIARSFTRYAREHPELKFHVLHFAQLQGTIKRSTEVRDGTEQLYRSTFFAVPLAIFYDYALPVAVAAYGLTGRFNPEHEWEARPTLQEAELAGRIQRAKAEKDKQEIRELKSAEREERERVLGTTEDWKAYRRALRQMIQEAREQGIVSGRNPVDDVFAELKSANAAYFDSRGGMWIEVREGERVRKAGISSSTILAPGSDKQLAYRLLLARADRLLNAPRRSRETLPEFEADWALLEAARASNLAESARAMTSRRQPKGINSPPIDAVHVGYE